MGDIVMKKKFGDLTVREIDDICLWFFISYTEYINTCYWHIYKLPVSERTKQ
ncbi:MAG: hypothetical protein BWY21_00960 [Parcubacteria group bacterium ADurb.Bin216]|nr:MAG: hypothetical protein BWY21_00960 [Parcubacteria group bacterium ADurb.Bin216]